MALNYSKKISRYLVFSMPHIATVWLLAPMVILQGIYAKHFDIPLTSIALVVLLARLFDAVLDPLVGFYSDRYYRNTGSRKPFLLAGGLLLLLASYGLYFPPEQVGVVYFASFYMAVYIGWTLFEIPHISCASELANSTSEKNLVYSFRNVAGYTGVLLFYCIPLLPFFDSQEITPDTLQVSYGIAAILLLPLIYLCLTVVPDGQPLRQVNPQKRVLPKNWAAVGRSLRWLTGNQVFLHVTVTFLVSTIGFSMWLSLIFIYVDGYLKMGDVFAQIFMLAYVVGILATPLWYQVANRWGKKLVWSVALLLLMISFIYTTTLTVGATSLENLVLLKTVQTLGVTSIGVIVPAMISESVDYGCWKLGNEDTAMYFSIYTLISKGAAAIASALALAIAGWYGFDMTASSHSERSLWGLHLAMNWIPLLLTGLGMILVLLSPISSRRHDIIRRRLDSRRDHIDPLMEKRATA